MSGRLKGLCAVVTGAASGIGLASARRFAEEGARVLAVDLDHAQFEAAFAGTSVHVLAQSVSEEAAPEIISAKALNALGGIDILFNNAGIATNALIGQMDDETWDKTLDVNLRAAFRLTRAAIPHLTKSQSGRVINTASVMAQGSGMGLAAYSASKAGLIGFTTTLAIELGKYGITANAILPGAIRTGMTAGLWETHPEVAELWAKKSVLRRLGEPDDIAALAVFLASPEAGFITGQAMRVDGGLSLREG